LFRFPQKFCPPNLKFIFVDISFHIDKFILPIFDVMNELFSFAIFFGVPNTLYLCPCMIFWIVGNNIRLQEQCTVPLCIAKLS
jgi:hypothetical protein